MRFSRLFPLAIMVLFVTNSVMGEPVISVTPAEYDFGHSIQGEIVEGLFTVTLEEEESAEIKILAGCSCMSVSPGRFTLTSESSINVFWTLDSTKYSGPVSFDVMVLNDSNRVIYKIQGNVDNADSDGNRVVLWIVISSLVLLTIAALTVIRRKALQDNGKMPR